MSLLLSDITQTVIQPKLRQNLPLNTTKDINIKTVNIIVDKWRKYGAK